MSVRYGVFLPAAVGKYCLIIAANTSAVGEQWTMNFAARKMTGRDIRRMYQLVECIHLPFGRLLVHNTPPAVCPCYRHMAVEFAVRMHHRGCDCPPVTSLLWTGGQRFRLPAYASRMSSTQMSREVSQPENILDGTCLLAPRVHGATSNAMAT